MGFWQPLELGCHLLVATAVVAVLLFAGCGGCKVGFNKIKSTLSTPSPAATSFLAGIAEVLPIGHLLISASPALPPPHSPKPRFRRIFSIGPIAASLAPMPRTSRTESNPSLLCPAPHSLPAIALAAFHCHALAPTSVPHLHPILHWLPTTASAAVHSSLPVLLCARSFAAMQKRVLVNLVELVWWPHPWRIPGENPPRRGCRGCSALGGSRLATHKSTMVGVGTFACGIHSGSHVDLQLCRRRAHSCIHIRGRHAYSSYNSCWPTCNQKHFVEGHEAFWVPFIVLKCSVLKMDSTHGSGKASVIVRADLRHSSRLVLRFNVCRR